MGPLDASHSHETLFSQDANPAASGGRQFRNIRTAVLTVRGAWKAPGPTTRGTISLSRNGGGGSVRLIQPASERYPVGQFHWTLEKVTDGVQELVDDGCVEKAGKGDYQLPNWMDFCEE